MGVAFTHCAGLDVHKESLTACPIVPDPTGRKAEGLAELKTFGSMTIELLALSDWPAAAGVTHVAMGSTGAYWEPVSNLFAETLTIILVHAPQVKHVPGRKTDTIDAHWLAKRMRSGLL